MCLNLRKNDNFLNDFSCVHIPTHHRREEHYRWCSFRCSVDTGLRQYDQHRWACGLQRGSWTLRPHPQFGIATKRASSVRSWCLAHPPLAFETIQSHRINLGIPWKYLMPRSPWLHHNLCHGLDPPFEHSGSLLIRVALVSSQREEGQEIRDWEVKSEKKKSEIGMLNGERLKSLGRKWDFVFIERKDISGGVTWTGYKIIILYI